VLSLLILSTFISIYDSLISSMPLSLLQEDRITIINSKMLSLLNDDFCMAYILC